MTLYLIYEFSRYFETCCGEIVQIGYVVWYKYSSNHLIDRKTLFHFQDGYRSNFLTCLLLRPAWLSIHNPHVYIFEWLGLIYSQVDDSWMELRLFHVLVFRQYYQNWIYQHQTAWCIKFHNFLWSYLVSFSDVQV